MSTYYIGKNGQQTGPYTEGEVRERMRSGVIQPADLCWKEGMEGWRPLSTVIPQSPGALGLVGEEGGVDASEPLFLYIPPSRLIWLSILSGGLYEAYWLYKNWRRLKERDGLRIQPFWRGVFGVFFIHKLMERIHSDPIARSLAVPTFSPRCLATVWVILRISAGPLGRSDNLWLNFVALLLPTFLCLLPAQQYVNAVTLLRNPSQRSHGWSTGHIVCIVMGVITWSLFVLGMIVGE